MYNIYGSNFKNTVVEFWRVCPYATYLFMPSDLSGVPSGASVVHHSVCASESISKSMCIRTCVPPLFEYYTKLPNTK